MISHERIKNITVNLIKESFFLYFSKPKTDTKHIILDRLFPNERRITSTVSGLQTSLGIFWEKLTKQLAIENNFEVIDNFQLKRPSEQPLEMNTLIDQIKTQRQNNGGSLDDFRNRLDELYFDENVDAINFINMQKGKGADVILKKNDVIYIYDIKTVQVNANNGNSLNETVILWICYYKYQHRIPANNIQAKLVFPYNSSDENDDGQWWTEFGGRISPLTRNEVEVGNDFWRFITDNDNALNAMIEGFDDVSNDNDFIDFYRRVFSCSTPEQLKEFSLKVKVREAEIRNGVTLSTGQILNSRSLLNWSHLNLGQICLFRSRINYLLEDNSIICPTCQNPLGI